MRDSIGPWSKQATTYGRRFPISQPSRRDQTKTSLTSFAQPGSALSLRLCVRFKLRFSVRHYAFETKDENAQKLLKGVEDLHTYVERNQAFVPNYGQRYRNGEKIASGFVESAINQVVSKRMVKRRRWAGVRVGRIFYCRYEPECSTRSGRTPSGAGTRLSALKASKSRKQPDPPKSPALRIKISRAQMLASGRSSPSMVGISSETVG